MWFDEISFSCSGVFPESQICVQNGGGGWNGPKTTITPGYPGWLNHFEKNMWYRLLTPNYLWDTPFKARKAHWVLTNGASQNSYIEWRSNQSSVDVPLHYSYYEVYKPTHLSDIHYAANNKSLFISESTYIYVVAKWSTQCRCRAHLARYCVRHKVFILKNLVLLFFNT